jgi:GNAT superfamily N-acetyltransferase
VAEIDGRICGFLVGERLLFAPEDFAAIYAEPRSISIPLHCHGVADGVAPGPVYEALYAFLGQRWIADGFFVHNVSISCLDADVVSAWVNLGFGRKSVCALRSTGPLRPAPPAPDGLFIDDVRGRDEQVLETFHQRLMTFQTGAPMFWPYNGEPDAKVRAMRIEALTSGQGVAFIARRGGEPVGSMLFVPAVFLSPLLVCERMVYLWEAFMDPDSRSEGVGSALLDHALAMLRRRSIEWCTLHFVSGNPRGGPFWQSRGFVPIESTMRRQVDERVSWARGPAARSGVRS